MPNTDTTSKELELLRKLRANPILADNTDLVMEQFEQELANGADATQTITHQAAQKAKELNSQSPVKEPSVAATLITQVDGSMVPAIEFGEIDQAGMFHSTSDTSPSIFAVV